MTTYTRTQAQSLAISQQKAAGYVITADKPSKVEMRHGGNVIVILQDGTVRRGISDYRKINKANKAEVTK